MDLAQLEAFALADDRTTALEQLIPGTEDYYYFHCLYHQHRGDLDACDAVLGQWIARLGRTDGARAIEHRQALLRWDRDPEATAAHLRDALGVTLDHRRRVDHRSPGLPTALDPALISRDAFKRRALAQHRDLGGFTAHALPWLVAEPLTADRRRHLLERLTRPDHPGLVDIVADDLDDRGVTFGSLRIHRALLLDQLEELARRRPGLLGERGFVNAWLTALAPDADADREHDHAAREAYLDRLWAFASRLAPAFNSLKVHVLYHRLALDRQRGIYDRDRFLTYLALPRQVHYAPRDYLDRWARDGGVAQLGAAFTPETGLPPVRDDEPLVADFLAHFFTRDDDTSAFEPYVRSDYLRALFAATRLTAASAGDADRERWYAMLDDPAEHQALNDRVDLELAPTCRARLGADEPVALDVYVKNVPTLVVKVFEINTLNFALTHGRDVDTSVDLDGLVATTELTFDYDEPPIRRVRRSFALDQLTRPGVYIVELIGGGKSSRALIRKGALRYLERLGAAGHVLTVVDEDGRPLSGASVWLGGRELTARDDGTVLIPYASRTEHTHVLLRHGDLAAREPFVHRGEDYRLTAGFYVPREQLVAGCTAEVAIRPTLWLNGVPVDLSLLEQASLSVEATDRHGVSATHEVTALALDAGRETTYRFQVPPDLSRISFALRGVVRALVSGDDVRLADSAAYAVNSIDTTAATCDLHLSATASGYVLYLLGKSGEPRAGEPVSVTLTHVDFTQPVAVSLQTDDAGRVALGPLPGIVRIEAAHGGAGGAGGAGGSPARATIALPRDACRYPRAVHARAGEDIELPYLGDGGAVSLLSVRGGSSPRRADRTFARDLRSAVEIGDGCLRIRGLPPGDYDLHLSDAPAQIDIRVAAGDAAELPDGGRVVASGARLLELSRARSPCLAAVDVTDDAVTVRVANASSETRVHAVASRFLPAHSMFDTLGRPGPIEPRCLDARRPVSRYLSGRDIGDEYRYILERRQAEKFAGNMLERPGVLLNPWDVGGTDTDAETLDAGGAYAAMADAPRGAPPPPRPQAAAPAGPPAVAANLDFLAAPALLLSNLRPDDGGIVRIDRGRLGAYAQLRLLLVPDAGAVSGAIARDVALPEPPLAPRDLRLTTALPADRHFIEKKQVTALGAGDSLTIDDVTTSSVERFDTLGDVYQLYTTLSGDPALALFRFILDWPTLHIHEQRARYSEHACHELNLLLARKDPAFFADVIAPLLRNKRARTFMDDYLLDRDLSGYLEPWAYARLNALERVLLADRLEPERAACARHIEELFELEPPDSERDDHLFRTALGRRALRDRGGDGGGGPGAPTPPLAPPTEATMIFGLGGAPPPAPPDRARARSAPPKRARAAAERPPAPAPAAFAAPGAPAQAEDEAPPPPAAFAPPGGADTLRRDADDRGRARPFYRPVDKTREWAESNYYRRRLADQGPDLIRVNAFWRDFAVRDRAAPFLSRNFAHAAGSFTEMMCALAVLDLPFAAQTHQIERDGARMTLRAASPAIVVHQEIKPVDVVPAGEPILVSQNYFRHDDRYMWERGERRDKFVRGELLVHTPYLCQVVLTNPTSAAQTFDLLLQIPRGALPVASGLTTRGQHVRVDAYATRTIEYAFYFPEPGTYDHFPVHVSRNGELVAAAEPTALAVVDRLTRPDHASWPYVAQHGADDDVLRFLADANAARLDLSQIAWRMRDRAFYDAVLSLLAARHVYDHALWSYSLLHLDEPRLATYLAHEDAFLRRCGPALASPLITLDPERRGWYEHLEYAPLVTARAHRLPGRPVTLNQALAAQYERFLRALAHRPAVSDSDKLAAAYYLLLQHRIAEGREMFHRVDPARVTERLQYDYLRAYVAFYSDDPRSARDVVERYDRYPVEHWRRRFSLALALLDEADGDTTMVIDADDIHEQQSRLIRVQSGFDFTIDRDQVVVTYQSLTRCQVNYYQMDIELLFSRQPFVQEQSDRFAIIRPNRAETVTLPAGRVEHSFAIPAPYRTSNIIVELVAGGERKARAHYAHELRLQLTHQYGQVRVNHRGSGRPLPRTYVKTYARLTGGDVVFYKDGYTDLCGAFDYVSVSTDLLDRVERFALLILHETHGAVIREAPPPKR